MTATDFDFGKRRDPAADRKPLSLALLISVLAVLALACALMIVPAIRGTADVKQSDLLQCATVDYATDRLACYDRIGNDTLRPPAKGALAPLGLGVKSAFVR